MLRYYGFIITLLLSINANAKPSWFGNGNVFSNIGSTDPSGSTSTGAISFEGSKTSITTATINDQTNGGWVNTRLMATKDQSVSFQKQMIYSNGGVVISPEVYLLEYRSDYRFNVQPMFIYRCSSSGSSCLADYLSYSNIS